MRTRSRRAGCQRDHLEVANRRRGQRRVLDNRDLTGQLREQSHTAAQNVVEIDTRLQNFEDRSTLGPGHGLDVGDAIDEFAVSLVGGDAAGTGVRLGDVALGLEECHVVAHSGARHSEVVTLDQCLGSHRVLGGDVIGHDCT